MKVRILASAKRDIIRMHGFLEGQQKGVGDEFRNAIGLELKALGQTAGIHSTRHGYHQVIVRLYHTLIYYRVINDTACVSMIVDGRMDPLKRERRLGTD